MRTLIQIQCDTKLYSSYIGQHYDAEFIRSVALNEKLWPRFQIHKWPGYLVRAMHHIMGICRFPACGQLCEVADFTGVLCLKFEWCLKWNQLALKVDERLRISLQSCVIVSKIWCFRGCEYKCYFVVGCDTV